MGGSMVQAGHYIEPKQQRFINLTSLLTLSITVMLYSINQVS